MKRSGLQFFGIKFNPFTSNVPTDALYVPAEVDAFCRRIENGLLDGGFAMITGDAGTGKSVALRLLAHRLSSHRDLVIATIDHPQSNAVDFYRELGDHFGVQLSMSNRWAGFKSLRARWSDHIASSHYRPILIIDEAQQMLDQVFAELRIIASKDFDSQSLLTVIFAGDSRLGDRFRHPDMIPLGTRIRRRLTIDSYACKEDMLACLTHLLDAAGNSALLSKELKDTLVDHAAGNYRVLMNTADELLVAALEREKSTLDQKLFLEVFTPVAPPKSNRRKR